MITRWLTSQWVRSRSSSTAGDVLAGRGDDQVLLTPGDSQEPPIVQGAEVAGMQPAVLVDHLLGGARVVPVARGDHGALDQDLAVGGDPDGAARDRQAHGADLLRISGVGVGRGAGLGHAVALQDGDTAPAEEVAPAAG